MRMRKVDIEAAAQLYRQGLSLAQTATMMGKSKQQLKRAFKKENIATRDKKSASEQRYFHIHAKEETIVTIYRQSGSLAVTAADTKVAKTTIYRILQKHGVIISPRRPHKT